MLVVPCLGQHVEFGGAVAPFWQHETKNVGDAGALLQRALRHHKRHPPNRPLSPIPAHDWTRPISYANNNFPDWSHGHPKAVSGMFKSRGTTYEPPRNLFSGLGADAPRSTPGVRHAGPLWPTDSLRAVEPRHAVTPFATWVTTNNTYGRPWHTSNNHFERTDAWLA